MEKLAVCEVCGNVAVKAYDSGVPMVCCGKKMMELVANTTEAATEKHLPCVSVKGQEVSVNIGEVSHPMSEAHLINWVLLHTKEGWKYQKLTSTDQPVANFVLSENDGVLAAYAYCNLHGLWKTAI